LFLGCYKISLQFNAYFWETDRNETLKTSLGEPHASYVDGKADNIEEIITEFIVEEGYVGVENTSVERSDTNQSACAIELTEKCLKSNVSNLRAQCPFCSEQFMHKSSLSRHMKQKHQGESEVNERIVKDCERKSYICKVCNKVFKFRTHLLNHEYTHSKPYKCGLCSETFADDTKLASHELNFHGELVNGFGITNSLMKCSYCPKVFPARSQLILHERTHTKEKPFQCSQCDKKFSAKCNLTAHERIHFGESKRYQCRHPPCTRKFSHTSERKDHETIHTGDKPYMCPTCGERYRRNANLWRHKKKCSSSKGVKLEEVDSRLIVEEDTDFVVHDPQNNSTTKYELVYIENKRKGVEEIHTNVASEQIIEAT